MAQPQSPVTTEDPVNLEAIKVDQLEVVPVRYVDETGASQLALVFLFAARGQRWAPMMFVGNPDGIAGEITRALVKGNNHMRSLAKTEPVVKCWKCERRLFGDVAERGYCDLCGEQGSEL